jgi:Phosphotransferase enzyme family
MNLTQQDLFAPILAAAERLLSKEFGREVRLGDAARLSEDGRRNLLLRSRDLSGGFPASFIIKKVVVDAYDPDDTASWDVRRFFSDWVGAQFLSAISDSPHSPRFYGGDYSLGFFILEDLGHHRSLVEPLLEGDAATAEGALIKFSACLGALHAATIGQSATFEGLFRAIRPQLGTLAQAATGLDDRVHQLQAGLDGLGVRAEMGLPRELEAMVDAIESPGPFLSYIHGDPCPDNVFWTGEQLRLIDFEFGRFGHALVDGTYGRMLFPTCWCANCLPSALVSKMEAVYRGELVKGCPEAQDDRIFETALARVCGFWLLSTLSRDLTRAVEADRTWGIATLRQRLLARLEAFITTAEACDQLPALRGTASRLLEVLRKAWPEAPPVPLYPAFQNLSLREKTT